MSLAGHATPAATAALAARRPLAGGALGYGALGSTGLTVSRLGFGGYRVDESTADHRAALERALLGGVNLVDTSTNYTDGSSERLIGTVVGDLVARGQLRRDGLVVVSKIGYVQGTNLVLAREREAAGRAFPEMVRYADGCWHSIHPEFLADQLARSLDRLGLETLDVCLLHNPEYFLADAAHRHAGSLEARRAEFSRRLQAAFAFFEGRVAAGVLRWYGVSSNTVAAPVDDPEATSLQDMLAAARAAGGAGHHFRVLQLPLNLLEAGAVLSREPGPAPATTVLDLAARAEVGVLVNRPLNAIVKGQLVRLADAGLGEAPGPLDEAVEAVAALEARYREEIAVAIRVAPESPPPTEFFRWAPQLAGLAARGLTIEEWREIESRILRPTLAEVVRTLDAGLQGTLATEWRGWRDRYLPVLDRLLAAIRHQAATASGARSQAVAAALDPCLPPDRRPTPLSRKALWIAASTPGVSVVLVGMRRPAYVDDALAVLAWPPLGDVLPAYEAVRAPAP